MKEFSQSPTIDGLSLENVVPETLPNLKKTPETVEMSVAKNENGQCWK